MFTYARFHVARHSERHINDNRRLYRTATSAVIEIEAIN